MTVRTRRFLALVGLSWVAIVLAHFPWDVDGAYRPTELIYDADQFYEAVYEDPGEGQDSRYVQIGQGNAHHEAILPKLAAFIQERGLTGGKALEVGAGSGSLQDVVEDYTGLDIASSAARYFHKPFVHGSATELPFADGTFDLTFSIWTLEHIPTPERALEEARRVTRDGGYLYLLPAWNNPTWAPNGWPVRPDNTLGPLELVTKYSLLVRELDLFKATYRFPARMARRVAAAAGPTRLRFRAIDGNFEDYWMPDSDAMNSTDCYEAALWFETRGDRVTIDGEPVGLFSRCGPMTVEVNKGAAEDND